MKKLLLILLSLTLIIYSIPAVNVKAATISKTKATMEVDSVLKLKINDNDNLATWKSSKKSVASVNSSGTVTAKSEGTATITATIYGNKYSCNVTVVDSNKEQPTVKLYGRGETWTVDGLWSLTFNGVYSTDDRNPYSDEKPDQVVILDYSYENIGYDNSIMDLYISSVNMKVIDEKGEVADTYPGDKSVYTKETPIGTKCIGAQEVYGLNNESIYITIYVEMYDNNHKKHKATFYLPVLDEILR